MDVVFLYGIAERISGSGPFPQDDGNAFGGEAKFGRKPMDTLGLQPKRAILHPRRLRKILEWKGLRERVRSENGVAVAAKSRFELTPRKRGGKWLVWSGLQRVESQAEWPVTALRLRSGGEDGVAAIVVAGGMAGYGIETCSLLRLLKSRFLVAGGMAGYGIETWLGWRHGGRPKWKVAGGMAGYGIETSNPRRRTRYSRRRRRNGRLRH